MRRTAFRALGDEQWLPLCVKALSMYRRRPCSVKMCKLTLVFSIYVVGVPEKVPVALLPQGRLTLGLHRGRAPRVISAMSPACQPSSKGASTCSSAASKASEVVEATSVASGPSPPRNSMQVGASGTNVCNVPSKTTQSVTRPGFRE